MACASGEHGEEEQTDRQVAVKAAVGLEAGGETGGGDATGVVEEEMRRSFFAGGGAEARSKVCTWVLMGGWGA